MIKSTILLGLSLLGFFAAPFTVSQAPAVRTITVPVQVISDGPAPFNLDVAPETVQTTKVVVVSAAKAKKVHAAPAKDELVAKRCQVRELQQGFGQVRTCE